MCVLCVLTLYDPHSQPTKMSTEPNVLHLNISSSRSSRTRRGISYNTTIPIFCRIAEVVIECAVDGQAIFAQI